MATVKKTTIKKAQNGTKAGPTYKNLRMGVANKRMAEGNRPEGGYGASKEDSASYRFGYGRGLKGEKEFPSEGAVQKMGRWEGQNAAKAAKAVPKKKNGGMMKAKSGGSFPDLNKDGKITKADILKGRGVIAKKGASVKAKSGTSMKKCKYGC